MYVCMYGMYVCMYVCMYIYIYMYNIWYPARTYLFVVFTGICRKLCTFWTYFLLQFWVMFWLTSVGCHIYINIIEFQLPCKHSRAHTHTHIEPSEIIMNLEPWIPKKCKRLQIFLDPRFKMQDSEEKFLNPSPDWHPEPQDLRAWIQELFLKILNLESWISKICKCFIFSWIQDSRFWGKVLESKPWLASRTPRSKGLDWRTFPQNLESWILNPKNLQTFANFPGFKIQDSEEKFLNPSPDWHPEPHDLRAWIQELFLKILNLESPKFANICKFCWGNFLNPGLD